MTKKEAQKKAYKILKETEGAGVELRSCWKCNGAHEHLKKHDLIHCFECGHWYYRGIDITEEKKK